MGQNPIQVGSTIIYDVGGATGRHKARRKAHHSSPNRQACSNTAGPSCARCSLYVIAVPTRASHLRETLLAVSGAGHLANGSKGGVVFALKLRFDSGPVYDRPYFLDPFVSKLKEYVFGKRDSLPVYMEAKQESFRPAVEAQTARYTRWLGNQQMDVKIEIRNRTKISLQHLAIA